MPLITDDAKTAELSKLYYPQIQTIYKEPLELSVFYLAEHFDLLFVTTKSIAVHLMPAFELFANKKMRFIYCPHGNSDKGQRSHSMTPYQFQDMTLTYGPQMTDFIKSRGDDQTLNAIIPTGNLRLSFYERHRKLYDALIEKEIFSRFKEKQQTLLYAPSWQDEEGSSSFFEMADPLLSTLPSSMNLLIKLHPLLNEHSPGFSSHLFEKFKHSPNIQIIIDFPLIYPLLNRCDLYLGDFSSVGYDFLSFDRPMFFFNLDRNTKGCDLHHCGVEISEKDPFHSIEKHSGDDFSKNRREMYLHAFGNAPDFDGIREAIKRAYITTDLRWGK